MKTMLTIIIATLLLNGCNSAVQSKEKAATQTNDSSSAAMIYFDSFAPIPQINSATDYIIRLHNDSKNKYRIISADLSPIIKNTVSGASVASLDKNNCNSLAAQSQCGFILNYPANNTRSYILTALVENDKHEQKTVKQVLLANQQEINTTGIRYRDR